ncbi:MAG: hypothetical protein HS122_07300 [Opitutaceae bacterium]|nr:hypothetical protein [Opitutaceae bacterium]
MIYVALHLAQTVPNNVPDSNIATALLLGIGALGLGLFARFIKSLRR